MFEKGAEAVRAVGEVVHVFVEREGRIVEKGEVGGMGEGLRRGLAKLLRGGGEEKARL